MIHHPYLAYTYTVTDSWKDSEGNIFFEIKEEAEQQMFSPLYCTLWKLSDTGETLEMESTTWDYPTEFDTDSFYYRIYYCQE